MKKRISILALFVNLTLAVLFGMALSAALNFNPDIAIGSILLLGTGIQLIPGYKHVEGSLLAGVYREIWTGELVENLQRETEAGWLGTIPDYSQYVRASASGENEVIHLVDIGADPEVLINNTAYPIGYVTQDDTDLPYSLDKFQTKATKVTDDELYAISYDKIGTINRKHQNSILKTKQSKGIFAMAPAENKTATPIVQTSGAVKNSIKLASVDDIIDLAGAMSDAGVPDDGQRVLVLNSKHVNGILKEVKNFYKDYANTQTGALNALFYGFRTFVYHNMPFYKKADGKKADFGVLFNAGTHANASIAFYAPDMFRANGSTKMYFDEPGTQNQQSAINYRHYYLAAPKKERAIAALVSADA